MKKSSQLHIVLICIFIYVPLKVGPFPRECPQYRAFTRTFQSVKSSQYLCYFLLPGMEAFLQMTGTLTFWNSLYVGKEVRAVYRSAAFLVVYDMLIIYVNLELLVPRTALLSSSSGWQL